MNIEIIAEQPPLRIDPEGVIRVGKTRVTLDTVAEAFNEGLSAEEIVQQYPSLRLVEVYGTIAYYLKHRAEVEAYLSERKAQSAAIRRQNKARFDMSDLRERLLARETKN